MSNFLAALWRVILIAFSSLADNPGGCTRRRPFGCLEADVVSDVAAVRVVAVVIEATDEGVQGVRGGGDMGVLGVLGHILGELGVVVEAALFLLCWVSTLNLLLLLPDRTSCLKAETVDEPK